MTGLALLAMLLTALFAVWCAVVVRLGVAIGEVIAARDRQIPTDRNRGW